MSDEIKVGSRVVLLDTVWYCCGDDCCQWEYEPGDIGIVTKVWEEFNEYTVAFDSSPDGTNGFKVDVDADKVRLEKGDKR